jgi:hypothetical protein
LRLSSQVAQEHHHPLNIWLLLVALVAVFQTVLVVVVVLVGTELHQVLLFLLGWR